MSSTPTMSLSAGEFITATATDASGNTSEFSEDISIVKSNHIVWGPIDHLGFGLQRQPQDDAVHQTITITNTTGSTIDGPIYLVVSEPDRRSDA